MDLYFNDQILNFDDISFWAFILVFGLLFASLLIANILIQVIKPLKKSLLPSPVLAGFLLLIFLSVYKLISGKALINTQILEMITYHALGIGFVATSLKKKDKKEKEAKKKNSKGIFNASLVTVGGYLIQAVVGLLISVVLFFAVEAWPASGSLLPMGYGQGPGQALNWGKQYAGEVGTASAFGQFADGDSFGLAIAALGFISASIGGLIYIAVQKRKKNPKFFGIDGEDVPKDDLEVFLKENEIPHSGTIDKATVQLAFVLITYVISFGVIYLISKACDASGVGFLINTVKPLMWGFNFIVGTGIAVLVRAIIGFFEKRGAIKKEYTNNYMMTRISGVAFDVMVVAAIGSINLEAFKEPKFILPLIIMGTIGCAITYIYCDIVCKHLYKNEGYYEESFLTMFGMLTGTASTGIILLREIDPNFKTPACNNMVFQTLWSVALGAPVLLLMSFLSRNWTTLSISIVIFALYFAVMMVAIFRDKVFKKKPKEDNN